MGILDWLFGKRKASDDEGPELQKSAPPRKVVMAEPESINLMPDLRSFDSPLKRSDVARVVGLTHAFITVRVLRDPQCALESDARFAEAATAFMARLVETPDGLDLDVRKKEAGKRAAEMSNPMAGLLWAGHVMDFATQNAGVMTSFCASDWAAYDKSCQECIAYTFKDFSEPLICAHYSLLRLRGPCELPMPTLPQTWSTFGLSCTRAGIDAGVILAREKLDEIGYAHFASNWTS